MKTSLLEKSLHSSRQGAGKHGQGRTREAQAAKVGKRVGKEARTGIGKTVRAGGRSPRNTEPANRKDTGRKDQRKEDTVERGMAQLEADEHPR